MVKDGLFRYILLHLLFYATKLMWISENWKFFCRWFTALKRLIFILLCYNITRQTRSLFERYNFTTISITAMARINTHIWCMGLGFLFRKPYTESNNRHSAKRFVSMLAFSIGMCVVQQNFTKGGKQSMSEQVNFSFSWWCKNNFLYRSSCPTWM